MGFDNECVVNIQSLPREYFCPVCRSLIYPNEAVQSQCTHLYCKPCLAYVVATTRACPYDGYLVTEADSKPLLESNKVLAETIGKVAVYCLYHRSGCQWQGSLEACNIHGTMCNFGNSPVVCNRCGTQIIHSQVQEHAQICPGMQPLSQQVQNAQSQAAVAPNQAVAQDLSSGASSASAVATAPAAASSANATTAAAPVQNALASATNAAPGKAQVQGNAVAYSQVPTAEQWYQHQQLQYQLYYQQYPGYDPYQQQYLQYAQNQHQAFTRYMQSQMQAAAQQVVPGQQQLQPYMQLQPQAQPQPQGQPSQQQPQPQVVQPQLQLQPIPHLQPQHQPHTRSQLQPQSQSQSHLQAQVPQMQAQQLHVPAQQPQSHPAPHGQIVGQHAQTQQLPGPPQPQARPPQLPGPPQPQARPPLLPGPPQQHPPAQMPYPQPHPQQQLRPQHRPPQTQPPALQPQTKVLPQTILPMQTSHPPSHAVSGYQSYLQPTPGAPQQHPMQMHPGMPHPPQHSQHPSQTQGQYPPQQPTQMRPSGVQVSIQVLPPIAPPQGQPSNLNLGQQVPQSMHQPSLQPHAPQHGFPHPQTQGHLHPGNMQQQGRLPAQQMYSQQPLRPQGPAYMQQHVPGQPSPQGLPAHQAQARPMMPNQGIRQQSFQQPPGCGPKLIQPGQSPNQTYPARSTSSLPTLSELRQSQVPHSGSQGTMVPESLAISKQGASFPDNAGQLTHSESRMVVKDAEGAESAVKLADHVSDSKLTGDEGKATAVMKEKSAQAENCSKELLESAAGCQSITGTEENVNGKMIDQLKVKEAKVTNKSNGDIQGQGCKSDEKSGASIHGEVAHSISDGTLKLHPHAGADKGVQRPNIDTMQIPQQMPPPGGLGRGQPVQPAHQTALPAQERGFPQPGYHDNNPSQFPQHYPDSDDRRGVQVGGPFLNQERLPHQQVTYGHSPNMPDPTVASQRPHVSDRIFLQPIPFSSQERKFPEPPHQMQVHGMRPPLSGYNYREGFPQQGQTAEAFWATPHAGAPGSEQPPPRAGFAPNSFKQHYMLPLGQSQTHMPPPHAGGARAAAGEPLARPAMGGQAPGSLDAPSRIIEGVVGQSPSVHPIEAESYAARKPGVYDGRQPETHRPLPTEHAPYGQSNIMNMNRMPNKASVGGMHDSAFGAEDRSRPLAEDRSRPLAEERFKSFPDEGFNAPHDRFRPSASDPGQRVDKREFEDLKQFPRPAKLDEGPKFDGYISSSKSSNKAPHLSGGVNVTTSRPLPSYQLSSPFPPTSGVSVAHLDIGERDRSAMLPEHIRRKHDAAAADPHNPASEFGRHRIDGLPPLRSPGREYDGFSSNRFGFGGQSRREEFDERDLHVFGPRFRASNFPPPGPGYFTRDNPDGPGSLRSDHPSSTMLPGQMRRVGPDIPNILQHATVAPAHVFSSNIRSLDEHSLSADFHSHMLFGDSGFTGHSDSVCQKGDIDIFEQSRKRKPGSTGWCRICKIDCETVEGLDMHSQTKEHQKMAMDLVLRIKQDNAKKHKLYSDNAMPFEDANNSGKTNIGNRSKRQ